MTQEGMEIENFSIFFLKRVTVFYLTLYLDEIYSESIARVVNQVKSLTGVGLCL